jgi:hypothetical protein
VTSCTCAEHIDELAAITVPLSTAGVVEDPPAPVTVGDLVEWEALDAEPDEEAADRWLLWFGDETRAHYDDDASRTLEDAVARLDGVSEVVQEDRETVYVTAADRCRDGMLAVAARALLDDGIRLR